MSQDKRARPVPPESWAKAPAGGPWPVSPADWADAPEPVKPAPPPVPVFDPAEVAPFLPWHQPEKPDLDAPV